jgi:N-acetylglucosaminyldiphosphoundecaprenol N-acetyl-beta-D-mannosaminyltransferase
MADMEILGAKISDLDMVETVCTMAAYIDVGRQNNGSADMLHHIVTLNAEILYKAQTDEKLMGIINRAALVTPDGSGIVMAAEQLCGKEIERVTGIDLMTELCKRSASCGWKVYLLGAAPGVAEAAAKNLQEQYDTIICGCHDGYFSADEQAWIIGEINEKKPDILFVALGAPRQEFWIDENRDRLRVPLVIGVGGCYDVISGNLKRAPRAFQTMGIEWLWRLLKEPWRFKRMMSLPKFALLVRREARRKRRQTAESVRQNVTKKEKK